MAFPQGTSSVGNSGVNATQYDITLPSFAVGDLIIVGVVKDGTGAITWPAGWTNIGSAQTSDSHVMEVRYRRMQSGDSTTLSVTGASEGWAHATEHITGHHASTNPEAVGTFNSAGSVNPNALSLDPTGWGTEDTLWIVMYGWDGNVSHTTYPTNFTLDQNTSRWANTNGCGIAVAAREQNVASQDPGNATISGAEEWAAFTIAVRTHIPVEHVDSGTVPLTLTPSATETFTQARRGQVYWLEFEIPEIDPSIDYEDSGTVYLDLQVEGLDLYQPANTSIRGAYFFEAGRSLETPFGLFSGGTVERPFTIGIWFKPWINHEYINTNGIAVLENVPIDGQAGIGIVFDPSSSNGYAYEENQSDFVPGATGGESVVEGTWHSIVSVFDAVNSRSCYVNAVKGATDTDSTTVPLNDLLGLYIGKWPDASWPCYGWIGYVFVWQKSLTQTEVTAFHNGTVVGDTSKGEVFAFDLTKQDSDDEIEELIVGSAILATVEAMPIFDGTDPPPVTYTFFADAATVSLKLTPSGTDEYTGGSSGTEYTDAATPILLLTPGTVQEGIERSDSATAQLRLLPSATEIQEAVESATVRLALTPSGVDERTYFDANTVGLLLSPSGTDQISSEYVDANTVPLALTPSVVEVSESVDTGNVRLSFTPSAIEAREILDTGTVRVSFTPSASEILESVDTGTVRVTFTPSAIEDYSQNRRGQVYWLEFEIPEATEEWLDSGTITLRLIPSATEEFPTQWTDANTAILLLTPSGVERIYGEPEPGAVRGLMALYVSEVGIVLQDAATVTLKLTVSGTEVKEHVDAQTVLLDLQASGTESADSVDTGTVLLDLEPSGVEAQQFQYSDSATIPLGLFPSANESHELSFTDTGTVTLRFAPTSTDTAQYVDSGTVYATLTPLGDDQHIPPAGTTVGTVYLALTPITASEQYFLYDTLLTATLSKRWVGTLETRRWGGSATGRWSGQLVATRRWSATLNSTRRWSAALAKRWAGTLGRK